MTDDEYLRRNRAARGFAERHWIVLSEEQATLRARLAGRHGESVDKVLQDVKPDLFSVAERTRIFAAYDEGAANRVAGLRCLCSDCASPRIPENERKRIAYIARRRAELQAEGLDEQRIQRRIDEEISRGMAL